MQSFFRRCSEKHDQCPELSLLVFHSVFLRPGGARMVRQPVNLRQRKYSLADNGFFLTHINVRKTFQRYQVQYYDCKCEIRGRNWWLISLHVTGPITYGASPGSTQYRGALQKFLLRYAQK